MGAFKRFANVIVTEELLAKWENVDAQAAAAGCSFEASLTTIWPSLPRQRLSRVMRTRLLSFHGLSEAVNSLPKNMWSWRRTLASGAEVTIFARESQLLTAQLTIMVQLPASVSASEAQAKLPLPGTHMHAFLSLTERWVTSRLCGAR